MNKATNGKGNIPSRDEWQTPQWLFDKLNTQYNFKVDCCANVSNAKCKIYPMNFLDIRIVTKYHCWMNPPFSKAQEMFKGFFKRIREGVAIYRCDNMETKIWQDIILKNASWVFIPNKRIAYEGMEGKGSRFPSALIGFNVDPPKELEGTLLIPNCDNTMKLGKALLILKSLHTQMDERQDKTYAEALDTVIQLCEDIRINR